ncbi:MAG: hypothetical protein ACK5F6_03860, partial [Bacteroidota bacterium]
MRQFLYSFIFLFSSSLVSQTSFIAVSESESIRPGNLVEVSFILKNGEGEEFNSPDFYKDFFVDSGPNTGLSTINQNGHVQREMR